jgi:phage terminase large subunit
MQKKLLILCAREFQTSIAQSVHRLLKAQVYRLGLQSVYDVQKTSIVNKYNGTEFIFAGLRHNIDSIRSMEGIDICWIEEGESISEESWEVLDPTIRSAHGEIWVSFNPREETDPTYKRMVKNPMPGTIAVKMNWQDNKWLSPRLRSQLLHMRKTDPERYHHIWEGGLWTRSISHVLNGKWAVTDFKVSEAWGSPLFGSDFGFSQDPTTLIKSYIDVVEPGSIVDGKIVTPVRDLYIAEEAFGIGVDTNDIPKELYDTVSESRLYNIIADSARPETISALSNAGYMIEGCQKWPGCVEDGIAYLRSFRKIIIHADCVSIQEEARLWSYKVNEKTGKVTRLLKPGFDHGWDAVRYGHEAQITHTPSMFDVQGQLL